MVQLYSENSDHQKNAIDLHCKSNDTSLQQKKLPNRPQKSLYYLHKKQLNQSQNPGNPLGRH